MGRGRVFSVSAPSHKRLIRLLWHGKRWKHSMILVRLEKEEVVLYRAEHFAAAGKAKLPVELVGVVEAEDVFGLLREEIFGFGEEFEGVALDNMFEVGEAAGFVLDEFGSGA
ncbi:hypothetical protein F0562_018630 [Nyssa sinensis]|uniref:Uncharacterized protein n=1 Tax=Nyssa sinensis TaxID=561372 RepID=A0A5J4ZCW2_9ASTE|nr:hypothetical protein F0562_018630 [Nyssa sinensis]